MRFLALDSWRGISALMVALFHLTAYGHFYGLPVLRNSDLLVDFFFVLSGFVISYSSYPRLSRPGDAWPFIIKRFGRVWPLHAVMLAAFVLFPLAELFGCYATRMCGTAWPFDPEQSIVPSILSNLLLVHSLGLHDTRSWNWPSWSISTEFYTYLLFALVVIAVRRVMLVPLAIALACISVLVIVLFSPRYMDASYDFGYFRCVLGFFVGFLTYRLYVARKMAPGRFATALEGVAVLLVLTFLWYEGKTNAAILAPLVFALCIYVFAHEAGAVSRVLKLKPFLTLGKWSYSIYMVHAFILIVLLRIVAAIEKVANYRLRIEVPPFGKLYYFHDMYLMDAFACLYLLTVISVASITYRKIEHPALGFFTSAAKRYERASALSSSPN